MMIFIQPYLQKKIQNYFVHGLVICSLLLLNGCSGDSRNGYQDIDAYIAEMMDRPTGSIDKLPEFKRYEFFSYRSSSKRSPFSQPRIIKLTKEQVNSKVKPDPNRVKQYLEQFEVDSFLLVGAISNDDGLWGLIRGTNGVHRVRVGDYLGLNSGRITHIDDKEVRLVEIIPAGPKLWIERPRFLKLNNGNP